MVGPRERRQVTQCESRRAGPVLASPLPVCRSRPTRRFCDGRRDPHRPESHHGGRPPAGNRRSANRLHRDAEGCLPQAVAYMGVATGVLGIWL